MDRGIPTPSPPLPVQLTAGSWSGWCRDCLPQGRRWADDMVAMHEGLQVEVLWRLPARTAAVLARASTKVQKAAAAEGHISEARARELVTGEVKRKLHHAKQIKERINGIEQGSAELTAAQTKQSTLEKRAALTVSAITKHKTITAHGKEALLKHLHTVIHQSQEALSIGNEAMCDDLVQQMIKILSTYHAQ